MSVYALCQDCMRIHALTALIPDSMDPPGRCPVCRGQACDCHDCLTDAALLLAGERPRGLRAEFRFVSWSADTGVVCEPIDGAGVA